MIDFDVAKSWHRIFADKIELLAAGLIPEPASSQDISDDTSCKLGQWLFGNGTSMSGLPAYHQLLNTHRQFHDIAAHYVTLIRGNANEKEIQAVDANFRRGSIQVLEAIDHLSSEIEAAHNPALYVSQFFKASTSVPQSSWDDALLIGLPVIDDHHKAIVAILDKLIQHPEAPLSSEFAVDGLTELGKILEVHFLIEESYMRQLGMPATMIESHRQKHHDILAMLVEFNIASYEHQNLRVKDVTGKIREWAIDHVVHDDLEMKKYLSSAYLH